MWKSGTAIFDSEPIRPPKCLDGKQRKKQKGAGTSLDAVCEIREIVQENLYELSKELRACEDKIEELRRAIQIQDAEIRAIRKDIFRRKV